MTLKMAMVVGAVSMALSGCGTVHTVLQNDADTAYGLRQHKTYCQSVSRVYSGVAYDFCVLNAAPDSKSFLLPFVLLDFPFSAVFDTLSLPYTVYRQATDGDLPVYQN